jgi:hypothetical protein
MFDNATIRGFLACLERHLPATWLAVSNVEHEATNQQAAATSSNASAMTTPNVLWLFESPTARFSESQRHHHQHHTTTTMPDATGSPGGGGSSGSGIHTILSNLGLQGLSFAQYLSLQGNNSHMCLHYINACIVVSASGDWNTSDTSAEASVITELLFASLHHLLSMQLMASDSFVRVGDCFVKRAFPGAYRSKTYVCVT